MTSRTLMAAGSAVALILIGGSAALAANSGLFGSRYDTGAGQLEPVIAPRPASASPASGTSRARPDHISTGNTARPSPQPATRSRRVDPPISRAPVIHTESESDPSSAPGRDDDD